MFRFFKNIVNFVIILFALVGVFTLHKQGFFANVGDNITNLLSLNKEKVEAEVGDFSEVNEEFNIDKAVKVAGYKTVVAKHSSSGQKLIIVDSGKKTLLTEHDITSDKVKEKLEDLCHKFKYHSAKVDSIEILDRGYMTTYGKKVPYVKFSAKISNIPMKSNIVGIISAVDSDKNNQRLIVSLNDKKHYSQLITSEFYKNVHASVVNRN